MAAEGQRTVDFGQQSGETTDLWLRRLISMDAPESVRGNVQALLEHERGIAYNIFPYPFVFQVKIFPFMFHVDMFVCLLLISAAYIHLFAHSSAI